MLSPYRTGIFTDALSFAVHTAPPGYRERNERVEVLEKLTFPKVSHDRFTLFAPTPASIDSVKAVHAPHVIRDLKKICRSQHNSFGDHLELPTSIGTYEAAFLAAGSVLDAIDAVMSGKIKNAFCAVRPPGHHASSSRPSGHCFLNNVAIGAQHLISRYGLERVAILDFDLHHGDGTQKIYYREPRVLTISIHGDPQFIFPFSSGYEDEEGEDQGFGFNLNVLLHKDSGDDLLLELFKNKVLPKLEIYQPQFFLIAAGFDAHKSESFKFLRWSSKVYETITRLVQSTADRLCGGKLVSALEGGYELPALAESVYHHLIGLENA